MQDQINIRHCHTRIRKKAAIAMTAFYVTKKYQINSL